MDTRGRRLAAALIVLVAGVAGCERGGDPEGTVVIGHYGAMTGAEATFGQSTARGIQLAVREVNAAGGIKGKKLEVRSYDDRGNSQEAGTAVTRLITNDRVV